MKELDKTEEMNTDRGVLVFGPTPTLVPPGSETPTSGTLTNCTDLPVDTGISGLGAGVATWLAPPEEAAFGDSYSEMLKQIKQELIDKISAHLRLYPAVDAPIFMLTGALQILKTIYTPLFGDPSWDSERRWKCYQVFCDSIEGVCKEIITECLEKLAIGNESTFTVVELPEPTASPTKAALDNRYQEIITQVTDTFYKKMAAHLRLFPCLILEANVFALTMGCDFIEALYRDILEDVPYPGERLVQARRYKSFILVCV